MPKFTTCFDFFRHIESRFHNPKALNDCGENGWRSLSTKQMLEAVKYAALGLRQLGMQPGDRVGILAQPSIYWTVADLAILAAGGVVVPLFANISDENFSYEVSETALKILFVEGDDPWGVFRRHDSDFQVAVALGKAPAHDKVITFEGLIDKGRQLAAGQPGLYEQMLAGIRPSDLAAIIYTSGSTGVPKGVELTQLNLACVLHFNHFNWDVERDSYLSVLPLAHVFGHSVNLWMLTWGVSIYYTNDYKNLGAVCREIKPTVTVVVPRLLEKIYAKMSEQLHHAPLLRRLIGEAAFGMAKHDVLSPLEKLCLPLMDKLVYAKLRAALGGGLRVVISGGAPLNPHLHHFYENIGVPIYEGWGLTEACPVCVNVPGNNKIGTVGPPLDGQQVAISPEGEVLVHGTLVMRGYYHQPVLTAAAITPDGWLRTGDRGSFDSDGHLTILGRMKELYKTSTGEYVAPVPIEQALCRYPLVDMAMVVAEGRKFTSCLLFPNFDVLARLKAQQKVKDMDDATFVEGAYITQSISKHIEEINKHLNHWEQIHGFRFILKPLSIEEGTLTPSMKIRREIVSLKYEDIIDDIYQEETE